MKEWLPLASVVIYWGGVGLRARQIKRRIGRSPNLRPRTLKEKFLWAGWALVSVGWGACSFVRIPLFFEGPVPSTAGSALILAGLAGTFWAHVSMGDAWRIGVRNDEKNPLVTDGPYRRIRHPLYSFQCVILLGVFLLAPSLFTLSLLFLHRLLVAFKIKDEERHMEALHGPIYKEYKTRTGALWPKV